MKPQARWLVPFDGSYASEWALRHALRDAPLAGATLHLLHVCRPIVDDPARLHGAHGIVQAHRDAGARVLAPAVAACEEAGVAHEAEVAFGPVVDTILGVARERGCAQIVIGTRGRSALRNLLSGSVANGVVRWSTVPVTRVRQPTRVSLHLPRRVQPPFIAA